MGRIVELCAEIAEAAEEGPEGLVLPPADWERFSQDFTDEEIEDALSLVNESLYQSELVEAADSLSARLVDLLGDLGEASAFARAEQGQARLSIDTIGQLARRVTRLEEVLDVLRDAAPPDRRRFEALKRRLADLGLEEETGAEPERQQDEDEDE
jgi:hypothetical protein